MADFYCIRYAVERPISVLNSVLWRSCMWSQVPEMLSGSVSWETQLSHLFLQVSRTVGPTKVVISDVVGVIFGIISFKMERNGYARCLGANMEPKRSQKGRQPSKNHFHLGTLFVPRGDFPGAFFCRIFGYPPGMTFGRFGNPKGIQKATGRPSEVHLGIFPENTKTLIFETRHRV